MEKQISIIIPTYNMEKYIGKCLDSLLIPEFDQVEVLVINDGSKDCSSEIAHEYANRYPKSIRVIDKENGNYGSCINAALPLCTGRYVKILDADDTFDTEAFSEFVRRLPFISSDVIVTPFRMIGLEGNLIKYYDVPKFCFNNERDVISTLTSMGTETFRMHNITYSTSVFKNFRYFQTEGISYTDTEWNLVPIGYCKTIYALNIPVYQYLFGREGQTMNPEQRKKSRSHLFRILKSLTKTYAEFDEQNKYKKLLLKNILSYYQLTYYTSIFKNLGDRDFLIAHENWLASEYPDIFNLVGELNIADGVHYKFIEKTRRRAYVMYKRLPFWLMCWIVLRRKLPI